MRSGRNNDGFSLTEVLLAVGTLAIGMIFIGGTFLAGIHFSTIATERTIAAVAADEAFAKVRLFGSIDPNWISGLSITDCNNFSEFVPVDVNEFAYPSTNTDAADKQYFWSALCRRAEPDPNRLVQVTVFVSRKAGSGTKYRNPIAPFDLTIAVDYPMPVKVGVTGNAGSNELGITEIGKESWINDGYTIVDDENGRIYRVLKRYADDPATPLREDQIILLDRSWQGGGSVWVIPPAASGGRYPCIAVYQTIVRF